MPLLDSVKGGNTRTCTEYPVLYRIQSAGRGNWEVLLHINIIRVIRWL